MADYVGWWGMRTRGGLHEATAYGKWHFVESEITDRFVMRCGRQLHLTATAQGSGMMFDLNPTDGERCEQCTGRLVAD